MYFRKANLQREGINFTVLSSRSVTTGKQWEVLISDKATDSLSLDLTNYKMSGVSPEVHVGSGKFLGMAGCLSVYGRMSFWVWQDVSLGLAGCQSGSGRMSF